MADNYGGPTTCLAEVQFFGVGEFFIGYAVYLVPALSPSIFPGIREPGIGPGIWEWDYNFILSHGIYIQSFFVREWCC